MNEALVAAMAEAPEPSIQLLAEAAENESRVPIDPRLEAPEQDDRSSSLSDIEDRLGTEGTDKINGKSPAASEGDTEAETERLEATPHKSRTRRKVVLSAVENASQDTEIPTLPGEALSAASSPAAQIAVHEAEYASDPLDPTSDMSSPGDSAEDESGLKSPTSTVSHKRKRNDESTEQSLKRAAIELATHIADNSDPVEPEPKTSALQTAEVSEEEAEESGSEEHGKDEPAPMEIEPEVESPPADSPQSIEDEDMEDAGAEPDAGSAARNEEELLKKKHALGHLSTIEKDFALLRDRLFSERTRQLNEELATLDGPNITHPEYLNMVRAIGQQRLDRINLAKRALDYKVKALQTKCIADRVQCHSQYAQTVRELRDESLRAANRECYQIQQERRKLDRDDFGCLYHLSSKRSELVAQQSSYNLEVSILSGVAKHVGFPAAPEMESATAEEKDEDLQKMGISLQPTSATNPQPQTSRPRPLAEEQFLERTPWANPQHPAHAQTAATGPMPRQVSVTAASHHHRPNSPFTPWGQRRAADTPMVNGSASTIAAAPSSSLNPTPMSVDLAPAQHIRARPGSTSAPADTPSRPPVMNHATMGDTTEAESSVETANRRIAAQNGLAAAPPPAGPKDQAPLANGEPVPKDVQLSPPQIPAQTRDTLMGTPGDRLHGAFGQPPGLAQGVKVGNA